MKSVIVIQTNISKSMMDVAHCHELNSLLGMDFHGSPEELNAPHEKVYLIWSLKYNPPP